MEPTRRAMDTSDDFERLRQTWQALGADDPLWAVLTDAGRRRGGWDVEAFLRTGEAVVARYDELLQRYADGADGRRLVLDFGCGVGRLSLAWSRRVDSVTGVDISASMIERGRQIVAAAPNIRLLVNERSDLRTFTDGSFDLVFSHICLQHMPWALAADYVAEFGRVVVPRGWVAFQMPSRGPAGPPLRRRVVDALPTPLRARYRRWRHGTPAVFDMYYARREEVIEVARTAGLELVHAEPDESAGIGTEGYIYLFRKLG